MSYLHITAVVRYDEAEQDDRRQTDDRLESEGVDGALWETHISLDSYRQSFMSANDFLKCPFPL